MHGDLWPSVEFSSMLCASFRMIVLMVSYFTLEQLSIKVLGGNWLEMFWPLFNQQVPILPKTIVVDSVGLMA